MLKTLRLHNFKTFLNAQFDFADRHLIIGANNSGKTNVCSALAFLRASVGLELSEAAARWTYGGITEFSNWHTKAKEIEFSVICSIEVGSASCEYTYDLTLAVVPSRTPPAPGRLEFHVLLEKLTVCPESSTAMVLLENNGHEVTLLDEFKLDENGNDSRSTMASPVNATMLSKLFNLESNPRVAAFRQFLLTWDYYCLSPSAMRVEWRKALPSTVHPGMMGENLANALFYMKNADELRYRNVVEHARIFEPDLEAVNFYNIPDQGILPFIALRGRHECSWMGLSDGTLRALAIAFIIQRCAKLNEALSAPSLAIIEEPENGIYPGQLRKLFDLFEDWAPRSQFIFTSHSPYFIDFFDNARDAVTLLVRKGDHTEIKTPPPILPEDQKPDRLTLAEQYALELIK